MPKSTTLLEIDGEQAGPGEVRSLLLRLLPRVVEDLKPRVIVLDLYLQDLRERPSDDWDDITRRLMEQINKLCDQTPVVGGFMIKNDRVVPM